MSVHALRWLNSAWCKPAKAHKSLAQAKFAMQSGGKKTEEAPFHP
jgi:hypothetical protein